MVNLLKTFGKGVLYIIGFPFFVVALVLFGVIGLFLFLFQLVKSIIYFFTGQKFFPELPEDKELREKMESANGNQDVIINQPVESNNNEVISPLFLEEQPIKEEYESVEHACFDDSEDAQNFVPDPNEHFNGELRREEPVEEEPLMREEPQEETINTSSPVIEELEEELEEYVPEGTSFSDVYEEEKDTGNGVDIDYDV